MGVRYEVGGSRDGIFIPLFKDGRTYKYRRRAEEVQALYEENIEGVKLEIREVIDNTEDLQARLDKCEAIMKRLMVFPDDLSDVAAYLVEHVYNQERKG